MLHLAIHQHRPGRFWVVDLVADDRRQNLTNFWNEFQAAAYARTLSDMLKVPVQRGEACPECAPVASPPPAPALPHASAPEAPASSRTASADEAPV